MTDKNTYRPCIYYPDERRYEINFRAIFHKFEGELAIIETEDGLIHKVDISKIEFVDGLVNKVWGSVDTDNINVEN